MSSHLYKVIQSEFSCESLFFLFYCNSQLHYSATTRVDLLLSPLHGAYREKWFNKCHLDCKWTWLAGDLVNMLFGYALGAWDFDLTSSCWWWHFYQYIFTRKVYPEDFRFLSQGSQGQMSRWLLVILSFSFFLLLFGCYWWWQWPGGDKRTGRHKMRYLE